MYKCVLLVRSDLEMSTGKIAAQCGHGIAQTMKGSNKQIIRGWMKTGEKIVVLSISSFDKMTTIKKKANKMGMFSKIIYDAGHTEVDPNTPTVCVVGPYHDDSVTSITNHLPLLTD